MGMMLKAVFTFTHTENPTFDCAIWLVYTKDGHIQKKKRNTCSPGRDKVLESMYGYVGEQHIGELCRSDSPKHIQIF